MIVLYGNFDLKEGISPEEFALCFRDFSEHLVEAGYVVSWKVLHREPHDSFNSTAPSLRNFAEIVFFDKETAMACWHYVAADEEPIRSYHRAVQCRVERNFSFSLNRTIDYSRDHAPHPGTPE